MTIESTVETVRSFIDDLADAKVLLDIDATDSDFDSVLYALINFSAEFMERWTERKLKSRTYTAQMVDGSGLSEITLPQWPVTAASALTVSSVRQHDAGTSLTIWDGSTDMTTADDVILHGLDGILERVNGIFPHGSRTVRLTYTAGYTSGASGDGLRFRQAQARILAHAFHAVGRNPAITNQSQLGLSQAFLSGTGPFSAKFAAALPDVRLMLDAESRGIEHGGVSLA